MRLVDLLEYGPFATAYHRALVNSEFLESLQRFFEHQLLPQTDAAVTDANGTIKATFDDERYCSPTSLVRNIFTLDLAIFSKAGSAELNADLIYEPADHSFSPRKGYDHHCYLWTPARKLAREEEMSTIQRLVDNIKRDWPAVLECPICHAEIQIVDNDMTFDVRCRGSHCFEYNYHKDEQGQLAHGHFFVKHPAKRLS